MTTGNYNNTPRRLTANLYVTTRTRRELTAAPAVTVFIPTQLGIRVIESGEVVTFPMPDLNPDAYGVYRRVRVDCPPGVTALTDGVNVCVWRNFDVNATSTSVTFSNTTADPKTTSFMVDQYRLYDTYSIPVTITPILPILFATSPTITATSTTWGDGEEQVIFSFAAPQSVSSAAFRLDCPSGLSASAQSVDMCNKWTTLSTSTSRISVAMRNSTLEQLIANAAYRVTLPGGETEVSTQVSIAGLPEANIPFMPHLVGATYDITDLSSDGTSLIFTIPANVPPGRYSVSVGAFNSPWNKTSYVITVPEGASGLNVPDYSSNPKVTLLVNGTSDYAVIPVGGTATVAWKGQNLVSCGTGSGSEGAAIQSWITRLPSNGNSGQFIMSNLSPASINRLVISCTGTDETTVSDSVNVEVGR